MKDHISRECHIEQSSKAEETVSRRGFLRRALTLTGVFLSTSWFGKILLGQSAPIRARKGKTVATPVDLAVVRGNSPALITRRAVQSLGGMGRFVSKGDVVVIKPNIAWNYGTRYATNTNPEVVGELVKMCYEAGAKVVKVFDNACINAKISYRESGIREAVQKNRGFIQYFNDKKCRPALMNDGAAMNRWPVYKDAVECDCFINVPVAKHHGLTDLTLSMKNLMGICGGSRGRIHWNISRKLAELTAFIKPDLTVIDCYRILLRHGPRGGSTKDVSLRKTVIAGTDPVLADSYAATLFKKSPDDIGYIKEGARMGLGSMNIKAAKIREITV